MVSENLFNDVLIPNEQKSSILKSGANFSKKMAQVDVGIPNTSLLLSSASACRNSDDVSKREKINSGSRSVIDNQKDDYDILTSDIELTIEDSDDKETPSESEETITNGNTNGNTSSDHDRTLVLNKDTESVESLDIDLSNTANLVGKNFLQDDFDSANSLDSVDEAISKLPLDDIQKDVDVPNIVPNSISFVERMEQIIVKADKKQHALEASSDHANGINDRNNEPDVARSGTKEMKFTQNRDHELIEVKVENETEDAEDPESETVHSESVNVTQAEFTKTDDASVPEKNDIEAQKVVQTEDTEKTTEAGASEPDDEEEATPPSRTAEVKVQSEPEIKQEIQNTEELQKPAQIEEPQEHAEVETSQKPVEIESLLSSELQSTPEPDQDESEDDFSLQVGLPESSFNDSQPEAPKIPEKVPEVQPTSNKDEIEIDKPQEKINNTVIDVPPENDTTNTADLSTADAPTVQEGQTAEKSSVSEIVNISDDASIRQIRPTEKASSIDEIIIHSPLVDRDDVCDEPKSVESTELQIIDLVDPEVVDLDDNEEPMELGEAPTANRRNFKVVVEQLKPKKKELTVTSPVNEKIQQFFDNAAKEIIEPTLRLSQDIHMDLTSDSIAVTGGVMGTTETEIPLSVLSSILGTDNRKRKHEDQLIADQSAEHRSEKRSKIDELKSNDLDKENRSITSTNDIKRKSSNIARKHTSSTSLSKTVKEIEKKIRDDLIQKRKESETRKTPSREPSPLNDFDQIDIILNESVAENVEIHCDDTPQSVDNGHKIKLNTDIISKDNIKNIFKIMRKKLTRRQLEEIVIQKCCEMISDSSEIGELRRQVTELQQAEFYRKQKILNLEKQVHQLKAVCQRYIDHVREAKGDKQNISPIKITRSVGLQVAIDSTPHIQHEPSPASRHEEKLKKLLTAPTSNKKSLEDRRDTPSPRHASTASPSGLGKNTDPKVISNYSDMNGRVSSPLCSSAAHCTSPSPAVRNNVLINKKLAEATSDPTVIDLTDKDDKVDSEANVAANNLLASVNGAVITYMPLTVNQEQGQAFKPGTQLIVNGQLVTVQSKPYPRGAVSAEHPAPVPHAPPAVIQSGTKPLPPKPTLRIAKNENGIMLSWNMPDMPFAKVKKYQLFAYQETNMPPTVDLWKAVGDVSALPLPMACTLTQFVEGYRYHFTVRAVDVHGRIGPFSVAESIIL